MGLEGMFEPTANFDELAKGAQLSFSEFSHNAIIEVDENRVDGVHINGPQVPLQKFYCNRPYLFTINNRVSSIPQVMFFGAYRGPQMSQQDAASNPNKI